MRKKWKSGEVINIVDLSPTVKGFDIVIEDEDVFEFRPGQFITLDLPIGEKRLDRWRSYSIVNTTNDNNLIQLAVSFIPDGRASNYFFNILKKGDKVDIKGPDGMFCLPEKLDKKIVMICTGTGVAPFKSMMQHIKENKIPFNGIHLIYGTRTQDGILYKSFFESLESALDGFEYNVALSREPYKGYQGYVHALYEKAYAKASDDIVFYLCGWQHVIDETQARLLKLGYKPEQIVLELYG